MRIFLAAILGALLAGCAGGGNVGEDSAALGDNGGIKGHYFSSATSLGAFSAIDFPGDGTFSGTLGGGNTVAGEVRENGPGHVKIKFAGVGGSACARLNAAAVVAQGRADGDNLTLGDVCSDGATYTLTQELR